MSIRRDNYGRYKVIPPTGGKPVGYTRVTTVAKTLDDGGGLIPWKATATMVGALRRPGLLARWQQLLTEHPDPWYDSPSSKDTAKKLVEDCATAGGSSDRAEIGTALHALIEARLRGGTGTPIVQPDMQADIEAFATATAAAGLIFDPDYIESTVVLDGPKVAGTADQLRVIVPGIGPVVGDLKTGADLKYSWQAIAVQLAAYAHADSVYVQGEAADGSEDRRLSMPEISRSVGLVIHLPAGEARCELHLVDLDAGWEAFQLALATRTWRARKNLARPHKIAAPAHPPVTTPSPGGDIPQAATAAEPVQHDLPSFDGDTPAGPVTLQQPATEATPVGLVAAVEPPPFDDVESPAQDHPTPAPVTDSPLRQAQRKRAEAFTRTDDPAPHQTPDEGAAATSFEHLETTYAALDNDSRTWIAGLAKAAIAAGVSFHAKDTKTVRRFEILSGLLTLCRAGATDDEIVRALLEHVIGDLAHAAAVPTGALLGSLSATEATQFARRCNDFAADQFVASIGDDGRFRLNLIAA